jgi:epoxyqueuosine reductase
VTLPDSIPQAPERLADFLADGYHGTMEWMAETPTAAAIRRVALERCALRRVFGMNYGPDEDPRGILDKPDSAPSPSMPATATITM